MVILKSKQTKIKQMKLEDNFRTNCETLENLEEFMDYLGNEYLNGLLNYVDDFGRLCSSDARQLLEEHGETVSNYVRETTDTRLHVGYVIQWLGY